MKPTFWNPMYAMKRPIPADTETLSAGGIALAMYCLAPVNDRIRNTRPEMNTITSPA